MQEDQFPNFNKTEDSVFTEHKGELYIGKELITSEMRDLLREQARYLSTSQLYEIFKSTIINEASTLALIKSENYDHVLSAKMLYYWFQVMEKMITKLTQPK